VRAAALPGPGRAAWAAAAVSPGPPPASPRSYDPARVRLLLDAAASMQRLALRRCGRLARGRARGDVAVLLHCDEGLEVRLAAASGGEG
jgi:hypothetical protein